MAVSEPGHVFELPDGSRYVLRTPGADVDGSYVEFEWVFEPGVLAPPPHVHPAQTEDYEVLEGRLDVLIGGTWQTLEQGQSASVPVGVPHTFRRPKQFVRVRNFHRPALGFEAFISSMARMAADRGVRRKLDPRIALILATAWEQHPETLVASRLHERLALRGGAAIARALGFAE